MSAGKAPRGAAEIGFAADVRRALDRIDPLAPGKPRVWGDGDTREQMLEAMGGAAWCDSIGAAVVPSRRDMFRLEGPEWLQRRMELFLSARLAWALGQLEEHPTAAKEIAPFVKFCQKQDTGAKARDMASSFKAHRPIGVDELDGEPTLLGTPVGVIDLDRGTMPAQLSEEEAWWTGADADYLASMFRITRSTAADLGDWRENCPFEPDPRWEEFVLEVMGGDAGKAAFLQRALGYSLYGGNPEKATFVLWGPKRDNGKSTLMNAVRTALGDYAGTAPAGLLLTRRFEDYTAADPVLAGLVGKRLVDVSEPPPAAELNGAMVKKLASGTDEVATRHLHRETFSYVPQFTIWMHCNALPVVNDPSAIDPRHMFVVEFPVSFSAEDRDLSLPARFASKKGMRTVLQWLVDGFLMYKEEGLNPPASVTEATEQWLLQSGTWLDAFVRERCVLGGGERCLVSDFKEAAFAFCDSFGGERMTVREINKYLAKMGVRSMPIHGKRYYCGLGLDKEAVAELLREAEKTLEDADEKGTSPRENKCRKSARKRADGDDSGGNPTIMLI